MAKKKFTEDIVARKKATIEILFPSELEQRGLKDEDILKLEKLFKVEIVKILKSKKSEDTAVFDIPTIIVDVTSGSVRTVKKSTKKRPVKGPQTRRKSSKK